MSPDDLPFDPRKAGRSMTYGAVHKFVRAHFARTGRCEYCGATDRPTEWANARLTRNRADWFEMCRRCHRNFDGHPQMRNLAKATATRAVQQRAVTHCPQGHAYDAANTGHTKRGSRYCRACARIRMAAKR
jgi:hypothetical protein